MSESFREQEVRRARELHEAGDERAPTVVQRLVALYPLDRDVRRMHAEHCTQILEPLRAGASLALVHDPALGELTAEEEKSLRIFDEHAQSDPLEAFDSLELRDLPDDDRMAPAARERLRALLAELERRDYPRNRLEARLYASRRALSSGDRAVAVGCVSLSGLMLLFTLGLAITAVVMLLGATD